jgi:hypothetical protein
LSFGAAADQVALIEIGLTEKRSREILEGADNPMLTGLGDFQAQARTRSLRCRFAMRVKKAALSDA